MSVSSLPFPLARRARRLCRLGGARLEAGDGPGAERSLRRALALAPGLAQARALLAELLEGQGAWEEAEDTYRQSLAADPRQGAVWLNLGRLLLARGRAAEALPACLEAAALLPGHAAAWVNLGVAWLCGEGEAAAIQAERCLLQALDLQPDLASAQVDLAFLLLRQGRYAEGWDCFEARPWYRALAAHAGCPPWRGGAVAGRHLLVLCEAGHGDMIQFCRYLPLLAARGARLSLVCHPALERLLGSLAGVARIIPLSRLPQTAGDWDGWVPLMSLPQRFATTLADIPAALPYLQADPQARRAWGERLPGRGLKVGLAWRGNPRFESDGERSLPGLDTLAPLGAVPGLALVSLQQGLGAEDALWPPPGLAIAPLGTELTDFAATAALIANLDLVISVDTAVAHLAGALGVPCWLLLPRYRTDWRWLEGRRDSPWYPGTMRLFRQSVRGDWAAVVAEVAAELGRLVTAAGVPLQPASLAAA